MNRIDRFEALAERLVEGTFARLFAGHVHPLEVATRLARAMEDHQVQAPDGTPLAPTHYWIYVHPQNLDPLVAGRTTLAHDLAGHVTELARDAGLVLTASPTVSLEPHAEVPLHSVRISARWQSVEGGETSSTREMTGEEQAAVQAAAEQEPLDQPFLIVDGERHVDLTDPVIDVGRALDNDIILESPRVSRHHAQLRRRYGRYILYDLGSAGGTTINGYPVEECVLQPGDVISLGGTEVIYGSDPLLLPRPVEEDTPPLGGEGAGLIEEG